MGLSVLMTTMNKVLMRDLSTFLAAFSLLILVLYPPLYTLYPRAGNHGLPHVNSFNSWYESLQAMVDLGLIAELLLLTSYFLPLTSYLLLLTSYFLLIRLTWG